jgi:hypothetical protein
MVMTSTEEVILILKKLSLSDRLLIIEEILKDIREANKTEAEREDRNIEPAILSFAGIMTDADAKVFDSSVDESRKVDSNEW